MCRIAGLARSLQGIPLAILANMPEKTTRRTLVPRTTIIAVTVSLAVVLLAVLAASLVATSRLIEVPDVTGMDTAEAKSLVSERGLALEIASTQVSVSVPAGEIISQEPSAGVMIDPGGLVRVVVSAGRQSVDVPDVVGMDVDAARSRLEDLGLVVRIDTTASETTRTIVLEVYPAPGVALAVGDAVRLTIPGGSSTSDVLLPYDLAGLAIAIDPIPARVTDSSDAAMDVARRLSSLLEAAGANVSITRSATETVPTPVSRTEVIRSSGATVLVGLDVGRTGTAGVRVLYPPSVSGDPARTEESLQLARAITRAARLPGFAVNEPGETTDVVVAGFAGTGVRVIVADGAAESDRARMIDPAWADVMARAIYRGIGTRFGDR